MTAPQPEVMLARHLLDLIRLHQLATEILTEDELARADQWAAFQQQARTLVHRWYGRQRLLQILGVLAAVAFCGGSVLWLLGAQDLAYGRAQYLWGGAFFAALGLAVVLIALWEFGNLPSRLWVVVAAALGLGVATAVVAIGNEDTTVILSALLFAIVVGGALTWVLIAAQREDPQRALVRELVSLLVLSRTAPGATSEETHDQAGGSTPDRALVDWLTMESSVRESEEGARSRRWRVVHYVLGGSASALAAAAAVPLESAVVTSFAAITAAIASGLLTAINPGKEWEDARVRHAALGSFARELLVRRRSSAQLRSSDVEGMLSRYEQILAAAGGPATTAPTNS